MRRTSLTALLATACVATLSMVALAVPAAGQEFAAPLTITKVVVGDAPADATFVIVLDCGEDNIINDGLGGNGESLMEFEFGPDGGSQTVGFNGPGECWVIEVVDGGAFDTVYDCVAVGTDCTVGDEGSVLVEIFSESQSVDVTVFNSFEPPPPPPPAPADVPVDEPIAAPAVVTPRYTG